MLEKQVTAGSALKTDESLNRRKKYTFFVIAGFVLLLTLFGIKVLFFKENKEKTPQFEMETIKRGDLTIEVTATGRLEPVTQVDIGIEVSGTVAEIKADFNDHVVAGQVLATLDTRILEAQVKQSAGVLAQAQANLTAAQATITEKKQALAFIEKARRLSGGQLPAKQDLIAAQANLQRALAQQKVVLGSIAQAEGQLKLNQTNLIKASIRTPISGIVLNRKIEKGQTVAASLQTPVMFTVAENLTEMELHVDVDEADVGKIKIGQPASFTVDAYPDKHFPATISQIRYAPETLTGVVTYETILIVSNADLLLRPGMTATAEMVVEHLHDALLVPSAALRFSPPDKKEKKSEPTFLEKLLPRRLPTRTGNKQGGKVNDAKAPPQVWILKQNQPVAIPVTLGLNDGEMNAVISDKLHEGMEVIVDTASSPK